MRWEARPQDQPGGALPPGIRIDGGVGIDIAPNASVPMTIGFQAEAGTPQESGTVFLVALARDSGAAVRGTLRLDYRLGEAQPILYAEPTYLELGVRQSERVSGTLRIGNRGLATATGVTARLLSPSGGPPPAWLFLASAGTLGALEVGQSQLLQIIAAPGSAVADGVFTAKVRIEASNATGGEVPISISVLQQGEGGVRFHLADLFTETLDAQGHLIPGLGGATLKVQNEAVTSVQHQVVTDAQGVALIQGLPPGAYRYRASAPNHTEVSGRLQIQPGVTLTQEVFLDYQIISVSFSVTETTIQDHYDLTLTATYQTQVPAPVVLLEPLAINLPDLQVGESLSGELSLTNYGLVQAEHLLFNPPASDEYYRYEFLGQVPQTLPAKTRINLPYRITARQPPPNLAQLRGATPVMGAIGDESYATGLIRTYRAATSGACSSYGAVASLSYDYQCANGEGRGGACSTAITAIRGSGCGSPGGTGGGGGGQDAGGFGGGGGGSHPAPIPLTPGCTPDCEPKTCGCAGSPGPGGFGPPGDGGDGGGGWSGGPGDGGGRPSPGLGGGGWPPGDFGGGFFIR